MTSMPAELHKILAPLSGRSFLSTADFSQEELNALLELAALHKSGEVDPGRPLDGKAVALLFFNSSLRTRLSMMVATQQLGGNPIVLDVNKDLWGLEYREGVVMNEDKAEHIKEAAAVITRFADLLAVRCFPGMVDFEEDKREAVISAFADHSSKPMVNMESATQHPFQSMADMFTIREKLGTVKKKKVVLAWTWHPKALPMAVPNSFGLAASQFGADLVIASPPAYELDTDQVNEMRRQAELSGGSVQISHNLHEACKDAEVVYAKSWGGLQFYGNTAADLEHRENFRNWIIDEAAMSHTNDGLFMHCLPVRRNVVVTDSVIDSPNSVVIDEAENRLHVQKTILSVISS